LSRQDQIIIIRPSFFLLEDREFNHHILIDSNHAFTISQSLFTISNSTPWRFSLTND